MLLLFLVSLVAGLVQLLLGQVSQGLAGFFAIIWFVVWIAYWNCAIIMTYHDLRVAKEGIDTEQIASIFD
jgi:TM2 domain-containing membrane protein YozV